MKDLISTKIFRFFNNYIKTELPKKSTATTVMDLLDDNLIYDININIGYNKSMISFVVTNRVYTIPFERNKVLNEKTGDIDMNLIFTMILEYIIENKLLKPRRTKETKKEAQQAEKQRVKEEKEIEKQKKIEEKILKKQQRELAKQNKSKRKRANN